MFEKFSSFKCDVLGDFIMWIEPAAMQSLFDILIISSSMVLLNKFVIDFTDGEISVWEMIKHEHLLEKKVYILHTSEFLVPQMMEFMLDLTINSLIVKVSKKMSQLSSFNKHV